MALQNLQIDLWIWTVSSKLATDTVSCVIPVTRCQSVINE